MMDGEDFRQFAKASIDYIADYLDNIRNKKVISDKKPGFLSNDIPEKPPSLGEKWKTVLEDVDKLIVPGLSHWHSPHFHAFYPTANSYPGIVGELFLSGLGAISKDWISNPACVELEVVMMDWLAKLLGLPEYFLNSLKGPGGGVIQNAASEATVVGVLSGIARKVKEQLENFPKKDETDIKQKLVAYTSEHSNCSVEKAGFLCSVPMRLLPTDKNGRLRGYILEDAIKRDKEQGLIPCCVVATLGTTGLCSFDNLEEIGEICSKLNIWLHVDAAYAGSAFVCPEYRYLMNGIEYADSFNFNLHKWLLVNSDCSAMWFKRTKDFEEAYKVKKSLRETDIQSETSVYIPEIENWQIPNSRRFRALKIWFVLRTYGVEGLQKHIRHHISLAEYFSELVKSDTRFEVITCSMGLVCFRVAGEDFITIKLLEKLTERRNIFLVPYFHENKMVIRFVICSKFTEKEDIIYAWNEILSQIEIVLDIYKKKGFSLEDTIIKEGIKLEKCINEM